MAAEDSDGDDDEDDLLAALESELVSSAQPPEDPTLLVADVDQKPADVAKAAPVAELLCAKRPRPSWLTNSTPAVKPSCLAEWPVEVRLCVAATLPWQEFMHHFSLLCRSWAALSKEESLWEAFFQSMWPRLSRRQDLKGNGTVQRRMPVSIVQGSSSTWKTRFMSRWSVKENRREDSLAEDWLDFDAARDMGDEGHSDGIGPSVAELTLQVAVQRCREDLLQRRGIVVPLAPDETHTCTRHCRWHRVAAAGEAFLCEASGALHLCRPGKACDFSVPSHDESFLVCPLSGHCVPWTGNLIEEVAEAVVAEGALSGSRPVADCEAAERFDWDPELGASTQMGRWFEQGYGMSEEHAKDFFRSFGCRGSKS
mmetsp:Transcript_40852/g.73783  ORF Transcript_40852/g.73783 Transcript_40852/m.73783 type:complete len:369 (-) Transcript_40852:245-1351(-)